MVESIPFQELEAKLLTIMRPYLGNTLDGAVAETVITTALSECEDEFYDNHDRIGELEGMTEEFEDTISHLKAGFVDISRRLRALRSNPPLVYGSEVDALIENIIGSIHVILFMTQKEVDDE